ncbi:hypothetical protein D5041_07800 [Verminephrobacter aporrectodeae subsp. tuberculatae]|nr:hypothetical protein [Verminephrobacter aporrectodeae subsp. tuberculatae]
MRAELEAHGLSAARAARDAGESDSQGLRDVLSGRKRLTADLLGALVKGTGIDSQFVLTGQRGSGLSAEEKLLLEYFRDASKEVRRAALGALVGATTAASATHVGGTHSQHSSGHGAIHIGGVGNTPTKRRK